jgi:lipid A disaccharide synthetase
MAKINSDIFIICGEKSGDNHGSFLVRELLKKKTILKNPLLGRREDEGSRC